MNKKFTLTLVIAIALISVIAFSACGFTAAAEGESAWDSYSDFPYPKPATDATSPGFGGYASAEDVMMKEGTTLTPITSGMSAWEAYQAMAANYSNIARMAQVTTTASEIAVHTTSASGILGVVGERPLNIRQYASWLSANDGLGSSYSQTISEMQEIGISWLEFLTSNFGAWNKKGYDADAKMSYSQDGDVGSMTFDENAPAGVTATWKGEPIETADSGVSYAESMEAFDLYERVFESTETEHYKVYAEGNDRLEVYDNDGGTYNGKTFEANTYNNDENGHNKVIYVEFKGTDGSWGNGTWYVWDDYDGQADGEVLVEHYVGFDRDRYYRALPNRGDAVSNYIVNEDTFDMSGSHKTSSQVDGHTLYTIDVKLTDAVYDWKLITSGELGSLQGSIVDFVAFDTGHYTFSKDLTLTYEVWDTGVIRRVIRQYSIATEDQDGSGPIENQILVLGAATAYGSATNSQIQEFAYSGAAVDMDEDMYAFTQGILLGKWGKVGLGVGLGVAVLIILIVTLVVLAKKGVIGKKKKNKKAQETEGGEESKD